MNERPPITVTAGGLVVGLKLDQSMWQADHTGCLDAPLFIACGTVCTFDSREFFPNAVCRDSSNDFPGGPHEKG